MSDEYRKILSRADEFFADVASRLPEQLECRRGCTMCCHGLFEVSSADVSMIIEGLRALDPAVRERIIERAKKIVQELDHPRLRESTPAEREAFFERSSEVPCPALDDTGACSIYEHRPIVCRTFGLPVREGGNYLGQECELNFTTASPAEKEGAAWDLEWEDAVGEDDQFTIPEAILLAVRLER